MDGPHQGPFFMQTPFMVSFSRMAVIFKRSILFSHELMTMRRRPEVVPDTRIKKENPNGETEWL